MKTSFLSVIATITTLAISGLAEARQIYWTGSASAYNEYECQRTAEWYAEDGARRSCVHDFRIQPRTCQNAPVVNVQDISSYRDYNGVVNCEVRVYISVP